MNTRIRLCIVCLCCSVLPALQAQNQVFSGTVRSSISGAAGSGSSPDFLYGTELYSNLRLQAEAGEQAVFYSAVNVIAASGLNALPMAALPGALEAVMSDSGLQPENYVSSLELERLYFRIRGEHTDTDIGLMRMAFGYGQAFRPTDFLNPPNPLVSDARPRGVIGANITAYPGFTSSVQGFAAAPRNPFDTGAEAALLGAAYDTHWNKASLQTLYVYQLPDDDYVYGLHRGGLSLKLDAEVGIVLDVLYAVDPDSRPGTDTLDVAAGLDYSFIDGKLYALIQYLYNASDPLLGGDQYLFFQSLYSYSDFTRYGISCLYNLDDHSFSPALVLEFEPFQAFSVNVTGRMYGDRHSIGVGRSKGELGPDNSGLWGSVQLSAGLRF